MYMYTHIYVYIYLYHLRDESLLCVALRLVASRRDGVELVDENDRGRVLFRLGTNPKKDSNTTSGSP